VAMIERVYGHFRNQSYQEAQARLDRERASRGLWSRLLRANELSPTTLGRGGTRALFVCSKLVATPAADPGRSLGHPGWCRDRRCPRPCGWLGTWSVHLL